MTNSNHQISFVQFCLNDSRKFHSCFFINFFDFVFVKKKNNFINKKKVKKKRKETKKIDDKVKKQKTKTFLF